MLLVFGAVLAAKPTRVMDDDAEAVVIEGFSCTTRVRRIKIKRIHVTRIFNMARINISISAPVRPFYPVYYAALNESGLVAAAAATATAADDDDDEDIAFSHCSTS